MIREEIMLLTQCTLNRVSECNGDVTTVEAACRSLISRDVPQVTDTTCPFAQHTDRKKS